MIDWEYMLALASEQGLSAIVLDGAQKLTDRGELTEGRSMDKALKKQWIGTVIKNYEWKYDDYRKRIGEMARFYNEHGFKLMVLKGYGLSLNYPIPQHRPCGDIDIWLFGKYKEADAVLSQELGIVVDTSHPHHTVSHWAGYLVENHYDWVSVYSHWSAPKIERIFKSLAMDDSWTVDVEGQTVYLPSPTLHALFLQRHALLHFNSNGLNLRQILDWGFLVKNHRQEIDWNWLVATLKQFNMAEFFACLNAICIEDFGFDAELFPAGVRRSNFKDLVLDDTLRGGLLVEMPKGLFPRLAFKYRNWRQKAWKRKLGYNEGWLLSFIATVRAHMMRPEMI